MSVPSYILYISKAHNIIINGDVVTIIKLPTFIFYKCNIQWIIISSNDLSSIIVHDFFFETFTLDPLSNKEYIQP
jgi:hypothetical protein